MEPLVIGIAGIVLLLILFFIGVPIAFAMGITGILGFAYVISPTSALHLVGTDMFNVLASYTYSALIAFILMGCMAFAAGIGTKAYNTVYILMGHLRGGLVVATVVASAIFGACCGSGAACCLAIGKTAIPEMKKHNYNPVLSLGAVACAGTLGFMIPPSNVFLIYGILTEQSIGKLFISGILPGILIMCLFIITALIICYIKPGYGPAGESTTLMQKFKSLWGLADAFILFLVVIGGLFAGFFGPTTAGAIGAAGAIIIGLARREINWKKFVVGLKESLRLSCMIYMLIVGAMVLGHFIIATNLSQGLVNWVEVVGLSPVGIVIFVAIVFFILGCFIDISALQMLLIPLFYPLVLKSGSDPIWFGVIIVTVCMIGIVTPPVATNLYVVKGLVGEEASLLTISKGIFIFLIPLTLSLVLLIAFPIISTFLPSFMSY